jgi:ectoine hydroxylase-related dioxygenase (phytanoyl-CoA dioxygenase family)
MKALTQAQYDSFWENGYLVVEDAVDGSLLAEMRADFVAWVDESRAHAKAYGVTINDKPRFDLELGHTQGQPALRRVNAPIEVSDSYYRATVDSRQTDLIADLIGPNVLLHHTKVNSKLPGAKTTVKWHQDFPFTPHSNDDLVTALLMIDEVTERNGPLKVVPGSHRGPIHSIWHGGKFTGAVAEEIAEQCDRDAVLCTGPAGAVCLMHTRLLHGSSPNQSDQPRTLSISVYSAEDAVAYSPSPMPNKFEGLLVRGARTNTMRAIDYEIALPQLPSNASFFEQQAAPQ